MYDSIPAVRERLVREITKIAQRAGDKAFSKVDVEDLDPEQIAQAQSLAVAAALRHLKDACDIAGEAKVAVAREHGASWNDVAAGTGYKVANAALQRYSPESRRVQRDGASRREGKWQALIHENREQNELLKDAISSMARVAGQIDVSADKVSDSADSIQRSADRLDQIRLQH